MIIVYQSISIQKSIRHFYHGVNNTLIWQIIWLFEKKCVPLHPKNIRITSFPL